MRRTSRSWMPGLEGSSERHMVAVRPVPAGIEDGEFRGLLFLAGLPEARSAISAR